MSAISEGILSNLSVSMEKKEAELLPAKSVIGKEQKSLLDPTDWDQFKRLGYQMLDDMVEYFKKIDETLTWQAIPSSALAALQEPLPLHPSNYEAVYEAFRKYILPYSVGNTHPRFWGWVIGTGIPFAMLSDMLVSGMNTNVVGYNQSAVKIEEQVIAWFVEIMGFPKGSSGLLMSGASLANHIGVEVALNAKAVFDIREEGLQHVIQSMILYCSTETHSWIDKTAVDLGLGRHAVRKIPVDDHFRIDTLALEKMIVADEKIHLKPFCVIGTAGTVNTGAIDNLLELSRIAKKHNLWFHIDGAFGSLVALSPTYKSLIAGQELADSIAFDFHKWMHLPVGAGCVLIRDAEAHRKTFSVTASYLATIRRGIATDNAKMGNLGLELSRWFNALNVWMALKLFGVNAFGLMIEKNIHQANYLKYLIDNYPSLELLTPVTLNIVCFRFNPKNLTNKQLDWLNKELLIQLQESGVAVVSSTSLNGHFSLRVAIVNHRSQYKDFDLLIKTVLEMSHALRTKAAKIAGEGVQSSSKNKHYPFFTKNNSQYKHPNPLKEATDASALRAKL